MANLNAQIPKNIEPLRPIILTLNSLAQRVKEQLGLLAIGSVVNDDLAMPGRIITPNFHMERGRLDQEHITVSDYHRLLSTLENDDTIYESSLYGGLSIALIWLLKINGYKVVFVRPDIGNIPKIKLIKEGEKIDFLPQKYCIIWNLPFLDTLHRSMDLIWSSFKS